MAKLGRDLPSERYGSWKTVYSRFSNWRDTERFSSIFQDLHKEPDFENLSIDSTSVRAHQHSAGAKKRKRTGNPSTHWGESWRKTTTIHTVVTGLRNALAFLLTGGQVYDSVPATALFQGIEIAGSRILGDKAYGSESFRTCLIARQASFIIPPKANGRSPWNVDWDLCKERHLVECFFNKRKHFRRIAKRYDK
ncbi:IS5 family transposase [Paenibacillus sp. WLX2291]|uniref:IS5 family transposase n=1 Tax=Paenibacillus sp. WLX2291 TaxID=3296934 RepID=UPI003984322E